MMMVLSGLLKSSNELAPRRFGRSKHTSSGSAKDVPVTSSEGSSAQEYSTYLVDEAQLAAVDSDDPDLRDLNNSLAALAAIFPDVQVEVFREMLSSFDEESRLAVVTETLLKHKMKWARGRYRVIGKEKAHTARGDAVKPDDSGTVPIEEQFRSAEYKKAVKSVTYQEFKGLSRSTINAVLAEHNHSYTLARPTLIVLSSKSWRFSISSIFLRRRPTLSAEAEHHPLMVWQSTGHGSIAPSLKSTGSPELDRELFYSLILPLQKRSLAEREAKDRELALEINTQQAEEANSLNDCECCFTSSTFEQLAACNEGGHFACYRCIRHAVNEAVFGQGWARNIDAPTSSLRCLAPMSDDCRGCISQEHIRRALADDKNGEDILRKLDERLVEDSLLKSQMPLIRCPFCSYAEVDDLYLPESQRSWQIKLKGNLSLYTVTIMIFGAGMIPFLLPFFILFSFIFLVGSYGQSFSDFATEQLNASITRMRRRHHGLKFTCQNPQCKRPSCISCSKAWTDIHICHESSLLALRTQVELAMSLAIKRTCPRCNTSFVKSSGCNKLTCVCGYQMCYVCRKDIGNGEGYRHFCEHFRPNGGRGCTECSKCDLYRCEDDEVVVKKAKEDAERQWMEKEGTNLEDSRDVRKVVVEKYHPEKTGWLHGKVKMPKWEAVLDAVVEGVIE
jgi:hypothetical protein